MATRNSIPVDLGSAAADLRAKKYAFGKFAGGAPVACSVLGERADFVIANEANIGDEVAGFIDGVVKIKVGAVAVAIHAELTTDANGLAITAALGHIVKAKALEAGAAGAVIRALKVDAYAKP